MNIPCVNPKIWQLAQEPEQRLVLARYVASLIDYYSSRPLYTSSDQTGMLPTIWYCTTGPTTSRLVGPTGLPPNIPVTI